MESSFSELRNSLTQLRADLGERLAAIEAALDSLLRTTGKRRLDPEWLSLEEAARLSGRSKRAVQNLIRRERAKPDGFPLRVQHGAVNRRDFLAFMESKARPARGEIIRNAVEHILER